MKTISLGRCLVLALALAIDPIRVAAQDPAALAAGSRANVVHAIVRDRAPLSAPLFGGLFHDIIGNRTRIIQASFVCIVIGIFILWKK